MVAGGGLIFISSVILLAFSLLRQKLYTGQLTNGYLQLNTAPIDYYGVYTGRLAAQCHSSSGDRDALMKALTITPNFIERCRWIVTSSGPLVAFVGDSHTLSMFPMAEKIARSFNLSIFSLSRDGCAFPEQGKTKSRGCSEVMKSTEKFIKKEFSRRKSSILVATSYLNSHFGYTGAHKKNFLEHSDGSSSSVYINLINYKRSLTRVANSISKNGGSIIVIAPLPQHPQYIPELCSAQWFRPKYSINKFCPRMNRAELERERSHIVIALKDLEQKLPNFFVYDAFLILCNTKQCNPISNGKMIYFDKDHLNSNGIDLIYDNFIDFLRAKKLLPYVLSLK